MKIRKAIIPVAGKGTRFLPATKQIPKEMLPIINRPMIDFAVEEAIKSGIEQIIFVTASGKETIENYFDRNFELESFLEKKGQSAALELVRNIGSKVDIYTVRQKEQLGLGHAVACARPLIQKDEAFAIILADDLVLNAKPVTAQLIEVAEKFPGSSVIGVMEIPREEAFKYGIVGGKFVDQAERILRMETMVEKPNPAAAPSNLATPGRYILTSSIFEYLERIAQDAGGEYQLTDAIRLYLKDQPTYAYRFDGVRYDTGSIPGYLRATIDFALADSATKDIMTKLITEKAKELQRP